MFRIYDRFLSLASPCTPGSVSVSVSLGLASCGTQDCGKSVIFSSWCTCSTRYIVKRNSLVLRHIARGELFGNYWLLYRFL